MQDLGRRSVLSAVALGLTLAAGGERQALADNFQSANLDLAFTRVASEAARKLLRGEAIAVRNRNTDYMPSGEVPLPVLEPPTEGVLRLQLDRVVARHSPKNAHQLRPRREGDRLVASAGGHRYWASLSSGAYKFTDVGDSMVRPSQFTDFKGAVQTALDFIAVEKVAELAEGETLDILSVSAVKNALTEVGEGGPSQEFLSDYYVVLGRRYRGVPVIGSRLVVRLNGDGKVVALEKSWRPIMGVAEAQARVSAKTLQALIVRDPKLRRYSEKPVEPQDVVIVHRACGYMEAPVNYRQDTLRPGCIVSFRVGDRFSESYPQAVLSLEEGVSVEQLWGARGVGP